MTLDPELLAALTPRHPAVNKTVWKKKKKF